MTPIHLAEVKNGEVKYFYPDKLKTWLQQLGESKIEVIFRKRKKQRSIQQNRYLWGVPYKIVSEDTGMSTEAVHNFFKLQFLRYYIGEFQTIKSTTELTPMEFNEYCDNINMFCVEKFGYSIPLPNSGEVEY